MLFRHRNDFSVVLAGRGDPCERGDGVEPAARRVGRAAGLLAHLHAPRHRLHRQRADEPRREVIRRAPRMLMRSKTRIAPPRHLFKNDRSPPTCLHNKRRTPRQ